jgi:lipid II:glycine glycyltransferase (peptidoglycan interpeptide bridge formation enzyme)
VTAAEPTKVSALRDDNAAWDRFVAGSAAPTFLQASPWAVVKRPNGWRSRRIGADTPSGPVGAQVLVRPLGPLPVGFGYAARGPLSRRPLDADALAAFTEAARQQGRAAGASYLRIDPEVEDPDGRLAATLRELGWRPAPQVQPSRTRALDLAQDEDAIWQDIHRKWRQSITKGARDDARAVPAGRDRIGEFYAIHAETMRRVGLPVRSEGSFRALFDAYDRAGRAHLSFMESPDGVPTATILLLGWGNRVVDLYGGTTEAGRRTRANYTIKWEAIKAAKAAGYTWYDLWGLPSEAVSDFKSGWGGREITWVGSWDLVLDPLGRAAFEAAIRLRARLLGVRGGPAGGDAGMSAT